MIKVIACEVLKEELLKVSSGMDIGCEFVPMGFHLYPDKLRTELQNRLKRANGVSRVILAFGLCGGAARGLKAADFILTIPKVHDCIPILLGSQAQFEQLRLEESGTFYLSCGWINGEKSVLTEYQRLCAKYGDKKASSILKRIYEGYKRILFIHTGGQQAEECLRRSFDIARLLNLRHAIIPGQANFMEKILHGPWDDDAFINIPPHGLVDECDFMEAGVKSRMALQIER